MKPVRAATAATLVAALFAVPVPVRGGIPGGSSPCAGHEPTLTGTNKPEVLKGTPQKDVILGMGGGDTIKGRGGNDIICGGVGPDKIVGGGGRNELYGESGNDELIGGPGGDLMAGGIDNDYIAGKGGGDLIGGERGKDQIDGGKGNDLLYGLEGRDFLLGGPGRDDIQGGPDADTIDGGPDDDRLHGNFGNDWAYFSHATEGLVLDMRSQKGFGEAFIGEERDLIRDIQNVGGTRFADEIKADDQINRVYTYEGPDVVFVYGKSDNVVLGPGDDQVDGGVGNNDVADCGEGADTAVNIDSPTDC